MPSLLFGCYLIIYILLYIVIYVISCVSVGLLFGTVDYEKSNLCINSEAKERKKYYKRRRRKTRKM